MADINAKSKISFIVVLTSVVLAFCILIGTVSAWLTKEYDSYSGDNAIGEVNVELYHDGEKITGTSTEVEGVFHWECNNPYDIPGNGEIRSLNLTMRNNGTIDALVRATVTIYYVDDNNNKVCLLYVNDTPTGSNQCKLDSTSWVMSMAGDETSGGAGGYLFYNEKLSPYTLKEIESGIPGDTITEVTIPDNEKDVISALRVAPNLYDKQLFISVTLDAIAYSGNIYKKLDNNEIPEEELETKYAALPFGLKDYLPEDWIAWK